MDKFILHSDYAPTGDQPQAIQDLVKGFEEGNQFQTLLGVTGSGKTFTMANVIEKLNRPTLVIAHNKTLAAQLYGEFKEFFPENAVEYFVSWYGFERFGVLKRPFYSYFPYNLDVKTRFGRNNTKRIYDLNSCNGRIGYRKFEIDVGIYSYYLVRKLVDAD